MGLLEHAKCNTSVECETAVQVRQSACPHTHMNPLTAFPSTYAHGQAFLLGEEELKQIMAQFPMVEERLWRVCGIRTATQLLTQLPEYQVHICCQPPNCQLRGEDIDHRVIAFGPSPFLLLTVQTVPQATESWDLKSSLKAT